MGRLVDYPLENSDELSTYDCLGLENSVSSAHSIGGLVPLICATSIQFMRYIRAQPNSPRPCSPLRHALQADMRLQPVQPFVKRCLKVERAEPVTHVSFLTCSHCSSSGRVPAISLFCCLDRRLQISWAPVRCGTAQCCRIGQNPSPKAVPFEPGATAGPATIYK